MFCRTEPRKTSKIRPTVIENIVRNKLNKIRFVKPNQEYCQEQIKLVLSKLTKKNKQNSFYCDHQTRSGSCYLTHSCHGGLRTNKICFVKINQEKLAKFVLLWLRMLSGTNRIRFVKLNQDKQAKFVLLWSSNKEWWLLPHRGLWTNKIPFVKINQ